MTAPYCSHAGCHDARSNVYGRAADGGTVSLESLWPDSGELAWIAGRSVVAPRRLCWVHARLAGFSALREVSGHVCRVPVVDVRPDGWSCSDCGREWVRSDDGWESRHG